MPFFVIFVIFVILHILYKLCTFTCTDIISALFKSSLTLVPLHLRTPPSPLTSSMTNENDKVYHVNELVEYQIQDGTVLQMILHQGASITAHTCSVCWFTPGLKLTTKESLVSRFLFPAWAGQLLVVEGRDSSVQMVGLSQQESGPIMKLPMGVQPALSSPSSSTPSAPMFSPTNLWVNKECYICSTGAIDIQPKALPLKMDINVASQPSLLNICFHLQVQNNIDSATTVQPALSTPSATTNTNVNFVFIQTGADILVKTLAVGEVFFVSVQCIVALEDTVALSVVMSSEVGNNYGIFVIAPLFFKIVGPGTVWFTSHTTKRKTTNLLGNASLRGGARSPSNFLVTLVLQLLLISISFYTISQLFEVTVKFRP
jgi:hypothetical protein